MVTVNTGNRFEHILSRVFQHPASHNLEWRDVIALMNHYGSVEHLDNGGLKFTINGTSQVFRSEWQKKDVSDTQTVLDIRRFLEGVGIGKTGVLAREGLFVPNDLRLVVLINRLETQIFIADGDGSAPEYLRPLDPLGVLHHHKYADGADIEARRPENIVYYKEIAEALEGADKILLIGNGTGSSCAMDHVKDYLSVHNPVVAARIVGLLRLDVEALTTSQLLSEATAFFLQAEIKPAQHVPLD